LPGVLCQVRAESCATDVSHVADARRAESG
jgi:hypothetical protein